MKEVQHIINKNKEAAATPDGIVVIGKDYTVVVFNEAASRITGFTQRDVLNKKATILFQNCPDGNLYVENVFKNQTTFTNLSLNLETKKSICKSVVASFTPIIDNDKVLSVVFVFRDVYEMIKMSETLEKRTVELIEQKNKLDAIFNSNIEGTFTINDDWEITSFNASAQRITGYSIEEAVGQKCWSVFSSDKCQNGCHMELTMSKGKGTIGNELEILRKDGRRIPIRVNSATLLDNKKRNMGAVETFIDISEIKNLEGHLSEKYNFGNIIGNNSNLRQALSLLESVSQSDSTVVVTGESGTGKELMARAIHLNSNRKFKPFVTVNCSAFVETLIESELFGHEAGSFTGAIKSKPGRFEIAEDGTLFLDEIGDLSLAVQTKLLRVIESREFERVGSNKQLTLRARIIAATNKDLLNEIAAGRFREDLYYRLNVVNIHLPPLRDRMDDLPKLTTHFIERFNAHFKKKIKQFSSSAFEILKEYDWPGNIRELENVVEHSFVLCPGEIIQVEHLPTRIRESQQDIQTLTHKPEMKSFEDAEKEILIKILRNNSGSRLKTAQELGINTSTLWRKMKKYDIT
ncbi:MAG: sigma 54-interacting transcriptional regulator [Ignavibacteriales bacterium]|nr:sigma 54-interacting transcriptional regulator [Ignavibacteriales bacterium]